MDKMIDKLNEILRWEYTGVTQYTQLSFLLTGPYREVFAGKFAGSATESLGHARLIGEKIVAMGGVPTVERSEVRQSTDLHEMLKISLDFESTAVRLYAAALEICDDRALTVLLEDVLLDEQKGVDELTLILRGYEASVAAAPAPSPAKKIG
ncbi:MAG: ferritin-like domain-containing protein [Planctomycetia bacterium]